MIACGYNHRRDIVMLCLVSFCNSIGSRPDGLIMLMRLRVIAFVAFETFLMHGMVSAVDDLLVVEAYRFIA